MAAAGGTGPVLATIVLLLFGVLSWYSLISFARAAELTLVVPSSSSHHSQSQSSSTTTEAVSGESLSAVWERIVPYGSTTKYIPDLGCVCLTIGCLLFYSAFIGDLFGSLISGITQIPTMYRKRWSILLLLHAVPILPLCLIKDLSALKYSSMTGLVGIVYTIVFVAVRLWDGSYAPGGKYHALMPTKFQPAGQIEFPSSSTKSILGFVNDLPLFHGSKGLLILMNMCCVACTYYFCIILVIYTRVGCGWQYSHYFLLSLFSFSNVPISTTNMKKNRCVSLQRRQILYGIERTDGPDLSTRDWYWYCRYGIGVLVYDDIGIRDIWTTRTNLIIEQLSPILGYHGHHCSDLYWYCHYIRLRTHVCRIQGGIVFIITFGSAQCNEPFDETKCPVLSFVGVDCDCGMFCDRT